MKKIILLSFALSAFGVSTMKAQDIFDKIDQLTSKADKASNTVDRTSNTSGKIGSLFGKKKKNKQKDEKASEDNNKTIIKISNIDLSTLKKLNSIVAESKGVIDTDMKYSASSSSIMVFHSGNTEDLLDNFQPRAKNIFTDKNIEGIDEGSIQIKIK